MARLMEARLTAMPCSASHQWQYSRLSGFGVGFQQLLHAPLPRGFFSRWPSGNGAWQHVSGLTPLLEVALDRRRRDLKPFDDLGAAYPFVNGTKNLLSHCLRICSHVSIVPPGSTLSLTTAVNTLPLEAGTLDAHRL